MPRRTRTRVVTTAQARAYLTKAEEFLLAAASEMSAGRSIAATSLSVHAAINAADAVTGIRVGRRAAGTDHDDVLSLLADAGRDGATVRTQLGRLLTMKTKAEYEPDDIPRSEAKKAVERATRCVEVARRIVE